LPDRPGLPAIPGDELITALQAAGFRVTRTRGSHRRLKHPDGRGGARVTADLRGSLVAA